MVVGGLFGGVDGFLNFFTVWDFEVEFDAVPGFGGSHIYTVGHCVYSNMVGWALDVL